MRATLERKRHRRILASHAYANGIEVAENKSVAASYFLEAAEIGHGPSQRNLGIMLGLGDGIPKNKVEAYAWLQIASVNKDEVAKEAFKDLKDNLSQEEIDAGKKRVLQILERLSKIRENHKRRHLSYPRGRICHEKNQQRIHLFTFRFDQVHGITIRKLDGKIRFGKPGTLERDQEDAEGKLVEAGDEHENAYLFSLREKNFDVCEISRSKEAKELTLKAIKDQRQIIFQPYLEMNSFGGYADFLKLNEDGMYEVWDTKLARSVKLLPRPVMLLLRDAFHHNGTTASESGYHFGKSQ